MAYVRGRATLPRTKVTTDADIVRARLWLGVLLAAGSIALFLVGLFIAAGARDGVL